jgi:hypothetical protein
MTPETNVVFTEVFNNISTFIAFQRDWGNAADQFDGAVEGENLHLRCGDIARSTDPFGRRIILIGTALGNVVVFDRDSGPDEGKTLFTINMPMELLTSGMVGYNRSLDKAGLRNILGDLKFLPNIGERLERLRKAFKEAA